MLKRKRLKSPWRMTASSTNLLELTCTQVPQMQAITGLTSTLWEVCRRRISTIKTGQKRLKILGWSSMTRQFLTGTLINKSKKNALETKRRLRSIHWQVPGDILKVAMANLATCCFTKERWKSQSSYWLVLRKRTNQMLYSTKRQKST